MSDIVPIREGDKLPSMPMAARYKDLLDAEKLERSTIGQPLPSDLPLIPIADCDVVIAELEQALTPCGDKPALVFARILLASYSVPNGSLSDPKTFTKTVAKAFAPLPADIAEQVLEEVTRTKHYLPNRADVEEVARRFKDRRQTALWMAQKHKQAQEKREAEKAREEAREERGERFKALREEFGELPVIELIRLDKERRGENDGSRNS